MPDCNITKPPRNEHELELRLVRLLGNDNRRMLVMRSLMASTIAGQFLPDGAVLRGRVNLARVGIICRRLFAHRRKQKWPALVKSHAGWEMIYASQKGELSVLPTLAEAIAWTNELIKKIDQISPL